MFRRTQSLRKQFKRRKTEHDDEDDENATIVPEGLSEERQARRTRERVAQDVWDDNRRRQAEASHTVSSVLRRATLNFFTPSARQDLSLGIRMELRDNLSTAVKMLNGEFWRLRLVKVSVDNRMLKVHWNLQPQLGAEKAQILENILGLSWEGSYCREAMMDGESEEIELQYSPIRGWDAISLERR